MKPTLKVSLVKDATGGLKLLTEDGQTFSNMFVKTVKLQDGTVNHLDLEVIYLNKDDAKNW